MGSLIAYYSRRGHSVEDLKITCPTAQITRKLPIRGSEVRHEISDIEEWAGF